MGDWFRRTGSTTIFYKWFQSVKGRPLPLPPLLDLEQNLKDASKLGEISGSRFAIRSAPRGCLERRALIASPSARTLMTSDEMAGPVRRCGWRSLSAWRSSCSATRRRLQ
jgi:hypothetical protein